MESTQFYLWLPSNSSMDVFPSNTLSEYRVQLPQTIQLAGEWEVALTEIQYPHSWNNVHDRFWNRFYIKRDVVPEVEVYIIPPGHYPSVESIIKTMNDLIQNSIFKDDVRFTFETLNRKVTVHLQNKAVVFFTDFGIMLGFSKETTYTTTTKAEREVDLDQGFHNLYVYCDVTQSQLVGDSQVPLVRIVPVEGKDGERISRSFLSPQYLPLSRKEFESIEVNIKRETGEKVPFEAGRVLITLHFRRASAYFH